MHSAGAGAARCASVLDFPVRELNSSGLDNDWNCRR